MKKAIVLTEKDNVATLLEDLVVGEEVLIRDKYKKTVLLVKSLSDIQRGHKIAIRDVNAFASIIKYGCVIGKAVDFINIGEYVHTHNLESMRGRGDLVGN